MDASRLSLACLAFLCTIFLTAAVPASKWEVKYTNTDVTCIVATFVAEFEVNYQMTNPAGQTQWTNTSFAMGDDAHVDMSRSFCYAGTANQTQAITLTWSPQYMYNLTIFFVENPSNTSFVIDKVLFEFNPDDKANFPNSTSVANQTVVNEMTLVSVPIDTAYECWTGAEIKMRSDYTNVSVMVSQLRVEAFRMGTNNSWYDPVQHCSNDPTEPTTTPTTPTTPTTSPTTTPSTTTPMPGPKAQWAVSDTMTGFQCVLANFTGKFLIAYDFTNPANHTDSTNTSLSIPSSGVSVDKDASTCNGYTLGTYNQMKLKWMNGQYPYALTMVFNMTAGVDVVSQLFLEYSLNDSSIFPHAVEGASWYRIAQYNGTAPVATISHGRYLKCDTGVPLPEMTETIDNKAVSGELYDVKLEAFRQSKTDTFDDNAAVCPGDEVTTTPYPITTSSMTPPPINVANYTIEQNGEICLMALFSMDLAVVWTNSSDKNTNSSWPALNNATVNQQRSACGNLTEPAVLAIENFLANWTLVFTFHRTDKQFILNDITFEFNLTNAHFPNADYSGKQWSHTDGLNALATSLGNHYMCKVPTHWNLNTTSTVGVKEIDLQLEQVQVEAFMTNGTWGPMEECAADNGGGGGGTDTSEIVPIAVGCALAALVIIVLIAYVIGRRRNRARGYESM